MLQYLKHIITAVVIVAIVASVGVSIATRVTEIYIDGTDEFVEITTDGSLTEVILSGAKSSPITLPLTASGSLIFADKGLMITGDVIVSTGRGRSFVDSRSISRTLHTLSGDLLQSIQIVTGSITAIDNTKTSLTLSGDQRVPTTQAHNALAGYTISPGRYGSSSTQTGSTTTGNVLTGSTDPHTECVTGSMFRISEVFVGSDEMSPFVEIQTTETIADPSLVLSGDLIAPSTITLTGQRYAGEYILLAGGYTGVISDDIDAIVSFQNLSQTGFLSISGQSGQVLDRVSVSPVISQSQNFVGQGCGRVLDSQSVSTPGYPQAISRYFTPTIVQEVDPPICPAPVALLPLVRIEGLRPAPPTGTSEAIAVRLFDDEDIDLDRTYILTDTGTKRYLRGPTLTESGSVILTGNFSLPNTRDACISLYSEDDRRLDRVCYRIDQARTGIRHGPGAVPRSTTAPVDTPTSSTGATLTGTVEITNIVYDPPGSDKGAEQITISNQSNQTFAPSDLRILIGDAKTKRYIKTTIGSGTTTATASFSLPNSSSTCVELHRSGGLLDTSCYTVTKTTTVTNYVSTSTSTSTRKAPITITDLVYNPPGSDTGRESITLSLPSDQSSVDLSDYRLLVGTVRKKLTGTLTPGQPLTITKTRGFPNTKPSCATLMLDHRPVDVRCRSPDTPQSTDADPQEPQSQTGDVATLTGDVLTGAMTQTGFIDTFSITDIIYDPDGPDTGREQLQIAYTGSKTLDLADAHLLINGRKKLLEGSIRPRTSKRLIGNFRFPNTKDTCVQLRAQDKMWDKYCYTIQDKKTQEQEDKTTQHLGTGSIVSLFPNPKGKDTDRERVTAIADGPSELRSLQINDRTTRTVPTRDPTTSKLTRRGTLSLPNRVGCVRLLYDEQVVDAFCYFSPQDSQTITTDRPQRHDLHSDAVRLLNRLTITRSGKGDQRLDCLRDGGVSIVCKTLPKSRDTTTPSERLQRDYISSLHQYMARNWSPIYYETDFAQQVKLYKTLTKAHRAGKSTITIRGRSYPLTTPREDLWVAYRVDSYYDVWMEHIGQHIHPVQNVVATQDQDT